MLMSLLQAVESGDPNSLDDTLGEMDTKVASLIGEGQGAPVAAEPAADDDDHSDDGDEDIESDGDSEGFSAAEMMASPADDSIFDDDESDAPLGEDTLPENAFAGEDDPLAIAEDDAADALDEDMTAEAVDAESSAEESEAVAEAEEATASASDDTGKAFGLRDRRFLWRRDR